MLGKVFVCCPGGSVSGGPELLHQLVDSLRSLGCEAYISYYPFGSSFDRTSAYLKYDAPVAKIEDNSLNTVVLPEVVTRFARHINYAKVAIWWLSVDNYYGVLRNNFLDDIFGFVKEFLKGRLRISEMQGYNHYAQSFYAKDFLSSKGINAVSLTDYLGQVHLDQNPSVDGRVDSILFNPKKGVKTTQKLISNNPDINFVPLINMTSSEVSAALSKAKIYIDFGHHPGKDRFPREAAVAGCCVVTGRQGSANNDFDLVISKKYKLDEYSSSFLNDFRCLANNIFNNYESCFNDFSSYRERIKEEPKEFHEQVKRIFMNRLS